MDSDGISKYVDDLEAEINNLKDTALQLTWAMRGGVQYHDLLNMCHEERKMVANISKENLEVTKKSGLPFF